MADHLLLDNQGGGSSLGMINASSWGNCYVPIALHLGGSPHEILSSILSCLFLFSLFMFSLGNCIEIPGLYLSLSHIEHI